jgi:type VI protein secretion system component Hcp
LIVKHVARAACPRGPDLRHRTRFPAMLGTSEVSSTAEVGERLRPVAICTLGPFRPFDRLPNLVRLWPWRERRSAAMPIDGYMELYRNGKNVLRGEALDELFHMIHASAILSFDMSSESVDKKKKKKDKETTKAPKPIPGKPLSSRRPPGPLAPKKTDDDDDDDEGEGKSKTPKEPLTFKISKFVDLATPFLYLSYCQHADEKSTRDKAFDECRLTLRKAGGGKDPLPFLLVIFCNAFVTKYTLKTDEDKLPTENITMVCKQCAIHYTPQTPQGEGATTVFSGWDFDMPEQDFTGK